MTKGVVVAADVNSARNFVATTVGDDPTQYLCIAITDPYASKHIRGLGKSVPWTVYGIMEDTIPRGFREALHLRFGDAKGHTQFALEAVHRV